MKAHVVHLTPEQGAIAGKLHLENVFKGVFFDLTVFAETPEQVIISWRAGPLVKEVREVSGVLYNHLPLDHENHAGEFLFNLLSSEGKLIPTFRNKFNVSFFDVPFLPWLRLSSTRFFDGHLAHPKLPITPTLVQMPFTQVIFERDERYKRQMLLS